MNDNDDNEKEKEDGLKEYGKDNVSNSKININNSDYK